MIWFRGRRNGILVLMFLAQCGVYVTAYGRENQKYLLKTLEQGVDQQLREVEFKCTYTYSEYVVDTLEEAENFDTSKGRLVVHATGRLAKNKKMTYESLAVDELHTRLPIYLEDHVTVTNEDIRANYRKQSLEHSYRTLFVLEREDENKSLPGFSFVLCDIACPLVVGGSRHKPNFLTLASSLYDIDGDKTDVTVTTDENFANILIHHTPTYDSMSEVRDGSYTVSNSYPYPVLIETTEDETLHYFATDTEKHIVERIKALDLVKLNNGCVLPKKVYSFSTIIFDDYRKEDVGKWVVKKWESDDMGKEKPKKSDFYIHLDRDSDIGGLALNLNYKLEKNLPKYFDINKYSVRDLQSSSSLESQTGMTPELTVWIRPAIILIAGLLIVFGIWKKWKNARQSASA